MFTQSSVRLAVISALVASLTACGGSGSSGAGAASSSSGAASQSAMVPVMVSDAPSDDWSTIGVKILSIALVPQGGGANVIVYQAPSTVPVTNLVQLDDLADVMGNAPIPVGTYTGAVVSISANPGDVSLVSSSNPESGFAAPASTAIPSSQIQIQNATGAGGSLTTNVAVTFKTSLIISASSVTAVNLEFDLNHPAFIIEHTPPALSGGIIWAVNFQGPVHHHPVADVRSLLLRHLYGAVTGVSTDNKTLSLTKELPSWPVVSPETAVSTAVALNVQADSANGTLFYDVDSKTVSTIKDFSSVASLLAAGESVRIAARYQSDGSLVAVRVWASSSFNGIWISPEGHVRHVDAANNAISVDDENGLPVQINVDANTAFFFRTPQNAVADATPIATGTAFLSNSDLTRGFKVHVSVADPLASPLVAQSIDIERAHYSGFIDAVTSSGFQYTHAFAAVSDDYNITIPFISSSTTQNPDATGYTGVGFQWWYLGYPTMADTGASAVMDFAGTAGGTVMYGAGPVAVWGTTSALWGDPADTTGWAAPWVVLEPTRLPLSSVTSPVTFSGSGGSLSIAPASNASSTPLMVDLSTTSSSATLAYQVDRTSGIVTVSAEDLTTSAGQSALTTSLVNGAHTRVYGVPQSNGHLKAYAIFYFSGTASTD